MDEFCEVFHGRKQQRMVRACRTETAQWPTDIGGTISQTDEPVWPSVLSGQSVLAMSGCILVRCEPQTVPTAVTPRRTTPPAPLQQPPTADVLRAHHALPLKPSQYVLECLPALFKLDGDFSESW